ncbi:hypothetical protein HZH68_015717 [Vespula germanica]|uniref:Uncharacterized protein n=1 Tax=Vespula germanica TaxID=30212 RepID=A0A834MSB2_VESGE|nr:hypothetical protein HZH68_015717 [Vespula germanica]
MKTLLILVGLLLEIHLYFTESHAKHQQESSSKNIVESLNALEGKGDDVLEGPISEVVAQSGGKAVLPCKITDPGAGTALRPLCSRIGLRNTRSLSRIKDFFGVQLFVSTS